MGCDCEYNEFITFTNSFKKDHFYFNKWFLWVSFHWIRIKFDRNLRVHNAFENLSWVVQNAREIDKSLQAGWLLNVNNSLFGFLRSPSCTEVVIFFPVHLSYKVSVTFTMSMTSRSKFTPWVNNGFSFKIFQEIKS